MLIDALEHGTPCRMMWFGVNYRLNAENYQRVLDSATPQQLAALVKVYHAGWRDFLRVAKPRLWDNYLMVS